MNIFIDVICGIKTEPKNWNKIFGEYQDLSKDDKSIFFLNLIKDISYNENQVFLIKTLCYALSVQYNQDVATQLRLLNPKYNFDNDDKLAKSLQLTLSATKATQARIKQMKEQLYNLQKGKKEPKTTDWDVQFGYISKFMGFKVNAFNTSVSEYCNYINLIKESEPKKDGK